MTPAAPRGELVLAAPTRAERGPDPRAEALELIARAAERGAEVGSTRALLQAMSPAPGLTPGDLAARLASALAEAQRAAIGLAQVRYRPSPRWRVTARRPKGRDGKKWQLMLRSPDGKLSQRSAKTEDEATARALAAEEEARLNATYSSVGRVLERRIEALRRSGAPYATISNLLSARRYAAPLFDGGVPSAALVREAQEKLLAGPRAPSTVNCYLQACASAWTWAYESGLVPDPWPRVRRLYAPPTVKRPPTREEAARLFAALRTFGRPGREGWLFPLGALLYDTGCRISEPLLVRERDVDRARCLIRLEHTKTKKPRTIRVSPEVMALLPRRDDPDAYVFENQRGKAPLLPGTAQSAMGRVRRLAAIPPEVDTHSLRRGWITDSLRSGMSMADSMKQTGHLTPQVHLGYARSDLPADADQIAKLRGYRGTAVPVSLGPDPSEAEPEPGALQREEVSL